MYLDLRKVHVAKSIIPMDKVCYPSLLDACNCSMGALRYRNLYCQHYLDFGRVEFVRDA